MAKTNLYQQIILNTDFWKKYSSRKQLQEKTAWKRKQKKGRNWTSKKTLLFVEILIDEEVNFVDCLERRALKISANEEVYKEILQLFQEGMDKEEFLQRNAKNFGKGKYEPLQVDTKELQAKYNAIKQKWREIKDRQRKGSGLAPKSNSEWYEKIVSVLGDTNTDLNELVSTSWDTQYSQYVIQNDNENESFEDNAEDDNEKDLYDDSEDDNESNNPNKEDKVENVSANKKKAILVKSPKKRKVVRSQT